MWLSAKRWCDGEQQRCARALLLLRPATPPARPQTLRGIRLFVQPTTAQGPSLQHIACRLLPLRMSTCPLVYLRPPSSCHRSNTLFGHIALPPRLVRCRLGSRTVLSVSRYHVVLELPSAVYHLETRLPSVCERGGDACRPGASRLSRLHLVCTSVHEISKMGYLRSLLCAVPSCV